MNISRIQRDITQAVIKETGYKTEPQNESSILVVMKSVFSKSFSNPYSNIEEQVQKMNAQTVEDSVGIMKPNVMQNIVYRKNLGTLPQPQDYPGNTSTYGKKIPFNTKIGF
jgi:hypothetical protein